MRNSTWRASVVLTDTDSEEPMNRRDETCARYRLRATALVAIAVTVPVLATGCSSSKKAAAATTANGGASKAAAPSSHGDDLSGNWKGTYGGAFSGTFTLTWTQSGGKLSGTITLSAPAANLNLNGTISGKSISFGTVGGAAAITYTGTEASGKTMSGDYKVGKAGGGTWSATKTS